MFEVFVRVCKSVSCFVGHRLLDSVEKKTTPVLLAD